MTLQCNLMAEKVRGIFLIRVMRKRLTCKRTQFFFTLHKLFYPTVTFSARDKYIIKPFHFPPAQRIHRESKVISWGNWTIERLDFTCSKLLDRTFTFPSKLLNAPTCNGYISRKIITMSNGYDAKHSFFPGGGNMANGRFRDCMRADFEVLTYLMHLIPVIMKEFDPQLAAFVSKAKVCFTLCIYCTFKKNEIRTCAGWTFLCVSACLYGGAWELDRPRTHGVRVQCNVLFYVLCYF